VDLERIRVEYPRLVDVAASSHVRRHLIEGGQREAHALVGTRVLKAEPKPPIRIFLLDSCRTFGDGLELAIARSKTLQVVGRACSATEAFENNAIPPADVAVVDIDLPDRSGFEVCQQLLKMAPTLSVVLIGYTDWDIYLLAAQTLHACGLLLRSQPTPDLIAGLEKAVTGPIFTLEQIRRIQTWRSTIGIKLKALQRREWQVLQLVALGKSNRDIAGQLSVSENTVEKHMSNVLQKLGVASRAMMMVFIYTHHLDALSQLPRGDRFLMLLSNETTS
jgi:DNA-binding NarL/FixJ family response regulator